ncbi:MAG: Hpt domain-containing protein [Oceanococcus sp.]
MELQMPQSDVNRGLFWVQGDVSQALQRARGYIETYLEDGPAEHEPLRKCAAELKEISNIAAVIQCYSVHLLATEMLETVLHAIQTPPDQGEANFAALVAATLQVSDYIELLAHGETDHPLVFAPNINDLRVARGAPVQSRAVLFSRFLEERGFEVFPPADVQRRKPGMSRALAGKNAPVMQKAVLGVIRDVKRGKALQVLGKASAQLASVAVDSRVYQCWRGVSLMCEVLAREPELINPDVQKLVAKAGQCVKALSINGEKSVAKAAGRLGAQCMHLGTLTESSSTGILEVRQEYALGGSDVTYAHLKSLRGRLAKPNIDSLQTVTREIRHNLHDVKDAIDLALRSDTLADVVDSLVSRLESVSATLQVVGLDALSDSAKSQADLVAQLPPDSGEQPWMGIAEALLRIEQGLEVELMPAVNDDLVKSDAHQDLREGVHALLRESLVNISRVKGEIDQYLARGQDSSLNNARALLKEMGSGFDVLGQDHIVATFVQVRELLVPERMASARRSVEVADRIADVVAGLEYYLEALKDRQPRTARLLEDVQRMMQAFRHSLEHVQPDQDTPTEELAAAPDLQIDPEFREIFIEESREVLAELSGAMPQWSQDPSQAEVLATVRRSFHTLKGSGRMVGARDISEFAWAVEDLLNQCIDGAMSLSGDISSIVSDAVEQLPQVIQLFADGNDASLLIAPIVERAAQLQSSQNEQDDSEDVLNIFRDDAAEQLASLQSRCDSAEADGLEVDQDLERYFHTLRGGAATAGLEQLAALAASAEHLARGLRLNEQAMPTELAQRLHTSLSQLLNPEASLDDASLGQEIQALQNQLHVDDNGVDLELAGVFAEEAMELLESAETELQNWGAQPDGDTAQRNLQRIFHTIKGSARTAGGMGLGRVGEALDALMKDVLDGQGKDVGQELFGRISQTILQSYTLLDDFRDGRDGDPSLALAMLQGEATELPAPIATELAELTLQDESAATQEAAVAISELQSEAASDDDDWPPDPEILEMFLAEGQDLLESMDGHFTSWESAPEKHGPLRELQRELHTFKGGARMSGLNSLGAVAHEMESSFASIEQGDLQADASSFGRLHNALDGLHHLLDGVKAGQRPHGVEDLLQDLRNEQSAAAMTPLDRGLDIAVESADDAVAIEPSEPTVVAPTVVAAPTIESDDSDFDPEMVEIFLPEGQELMEAFDGACQQFAENSEQSVPELLRVLHTLKGGARMSGLSALGDAAHNLESDLETLSRDGQIADSDWPGQLQQASDFFHQQLQVARNRIGGAAPTALEPEPYVATEVAQEHSDVAVEKAESTPAISPVPLEIKYPAARKWAADLQWEAPHDERLAAIRRETARVSVDRLDSMLNEAGEISIYRSRLERQVNSFSAQLREIEQTISRIRDQLRMLESETDAQVQARTHGMQSEDEASDRYQEEFDPLEMDRYSRMQELTRALTESVTDLSSLHATMTDVVSETDTLLLQQGRVNTSVQQGLMSTLMVPFSRQIQRLQRVVRQAAGEHGKQAELSLHGIEAEMDRNVLERMTPVIEHVLRNCVIHGLEDGAGRRASGKPASGSISINLKRDGSKLAIEIRDDGRGLDFQRIREKAIERGMMGSDAELGDAELAQFIFQPGFSTAQTLTQDAGRGVGMDVVSSEIKQLGGTLELDSQRGKGTRFLIRLPLSLAISQALLVQVADEVYAAPLSTIEGIARIPVSELAGYMDEDHRFQYGEHDYRVRYLGHLLGLEGGLPEDRDYVSVILVHTGEGMGISDRRVAVAVDHLLGSRELVTKTAGPQVSTVVGVTGATIQSDGRVVLILDVVALVQDRLFKSLQAADAQAALETSKRQDPLVMVIDDSITMRRVAERLLSRNGYRVATAKDGMDGIALLQTEMPDAVLLDIEMPKVDGFEVASFIRNNDRLAKLPIIMITSRSGDKHRERAEAIGVNRYLIKPYQEQQLISELRDVMAEEA